MTETLQEKRTETVAASVTPTELWQVKLVSRKTGKPVSELLRTNTLVSLIEWGERLDAALSELEPAEKVA